MVWVVGCIWRCSKFQEGVAGNASRGMWTLLVKRKRQSGGVWSEANINGAGSCNEKGNMRMCSMKHKYNGHKTNG